MKLRVYILFLLLSKTSFAQNCDVEQIKDLLQNKQYALVYSMADALKECTGINELDIEWANFHQAICALELFNDEAKFRIEKYLENYPNGLYTNDAYIALSKYHFRNKEYEKVIAKLSNVNLYDLDFHQQAMYFFRLGYSYFYLDKYDEAKLAFYDIKSISFTYSELTIYCLSHMDYEEGNYASALQGFKQLISTPTLGAISKYYITHIYYYQKRYNELIEFARPLFVNSYNPKRDLELKRMIGDAYFALGKYQNSIDYLEDYMSDDNFVKLDRVEKYQLGLAYFELHDYSKAAIQFEEILFNEDSLSQFAAHQLGQCYLLMDEKPLAINAFKYASAINFDYTIKEDAAFNFVKLIYEQQSSLFNVVEIIEQFIDEYPQSVHIEYIQDLLIKAYTNTKDFQTAIDKLSALSIMTLPQQQVFQNLSYYLAVEHFLNNRYQQSVIFFDKSIKYPLNNKLFALAYYWKAEAYYHVKDYVSAIESFKAFIVKDGSFLLQEYEQAHYSLAYTYYQSQKYEDAILWFRKYISFSRDIKKQSDAYLRLGDAYFMIQDYNRAQEFYYLAEKSGIFDTDYAIHQQIQCFGLTNRRDEKRTALTQLISNYPMSLYNDDAMLNLGIMYLNEDRRDESVFLLSELIKKHPNSILVKTALLKIGLNFYNQNMSDSAIYYFQSVIEDYAHTKESKEALIAYKNISIESGDVKSYFDYLGELSDITVDIASRDSISYEASENLYLRQDYEKAVDALDNYLKEFDNPIFKLNAHFYKAESIFTSNPNDAVEDYLSVLEFPQNIFTERALTRLARIEFKKERYGVAALHYSNLKKIAQENSLLREATKNLFYCYKNLGLNTSLLESAKQILDLDKVDNELINEARLIIANNFFDKSEFHLAKKEYIKIVDQNQSEIGSEAKYQLAYLSYLESDFDKSEKIIFELADNYYSDFYIAKSFILLADIYKEKNNLFQSKATLQSIVDNYEGKDLIEICLKKIEEIDLINTEAQMNSQKDELIINLLNDIKFNQLFEEENNLENE